MKVINNYNDFEIIEKLINKGDSKWFGILYDRYASRVYNKSLMLVHDQNVAKDLTQDIFIKAFINITKFKKDSSFYTWLYAIVYNTCLDYLKKSKKYKMQSADKALKNYPADEMKDQELMNIAYDRLKVLLEKIPTDDKLILLMKYQDDMTIKEIGTCFNIGESTVKMRLNRAKGKILYMYNDKFRHSIYYLNK